MIEDDLLKYSVKLPNGSGCLFQPMSTEYTYVLTAKHLFEDVDCEPGADDHFDIEIVRHVFIQGQWKEVPMLFKPELGVTYFPHDHADCAILKVPFLEGYGELFSEKTVNTKEGYRLCGFPRDTRDRPLGENFSSHNATVLNSTNHAHVAQLPQILVKDNIAMMSGGGYLKIEGDHLRVLGVQSGMASEEDHALGRTIFVPMRFFDEIVTYESFRNELEHLLPPYLSSFFFLGDDIFNMEVGVVEDIVAKKTRLSNILKAKAREIRDSDITPNYIQDYLGSRLLLLEQKDVHLQKQGIWKMWLELLTILNIAKDNVHSLADMPEIFQRVRMFYSDVNGDFWTNHLHDLHKQDYSGLLRDGIVVVGSRVKSADSEMAVLDLDRITGDIAKAKMEYEEGQIGQEIDTATDFPFDKYTYVNISYFKENTVSELENGFTEDSLANCLTILKELYEQLIPDW